MQVFDSTFGMGYGTILTPVLILMGVPADIAVPSVLISGIAGGAITSLFHHNLKNADFKKGSKDANIAIIISTFGIASTIIAAFINVVLSNLLINLYIAVMMIGVGVFTLLNIKFKFSWITIFFTGIFSAFNKGLTGGGFGPIVTAGQVMSGQKHTNAIAVTTASEVPISIAAFLTFVVTKIALESEKAINLSNMRDILTNFEIFDWRIIAILSIAAVIAGPIGAHITFHLDDKKLHIYLGGAILIIGITLIIHTLF
jgi:hypothetical protein